MSHSHAQRMHYMQQQQRAAHAHAQAAQAHPYQSRQSHPSQSSQYQSRQSQYSQSSQGQRPPSQQLPQQRATPNASVKSLPQTPTGSQVSGSAQYPQYQGSRSGQSGQQPVPYRPQHPSYTSGHHSDGGAPPSYDEHYYHSRPPSMGARSHSRSSMGAAYPSHSRSLGASKASLATYRSGKSSIQQEYHDRRIQSRMSSIYTGRSRTPFCIAMVLFILAVLVFFTGLGLTIARAVGNIYIPSDAADAVGPIVLCIGILLAAAGIKFVYDAYRISEKEQRRLRFTARGESSVSVNTVSSRLPDPGEQLASGSSTQNAITRTPVGSRNTLTAV